ncbi:MAG: tRNA pseudouridine(54/55) synthase Pus10 [Candidatus Aenigmatarchaeota archaeon]
MKIEEKVVEILKEGFVCDNCLGRFFAELLSGFSNKERGRILRNYLAFLIDSGERIDVDLSNFYGIKFRNVKLEIKELEKCKVCQNFFEEEIDELAKRIVEELKGVEFKTFLIGSIPRDEMQNEEEKIQEKIGIEFAELIKSEINRELGKRVEKLSGKKFSTKNPDVTIIVNLKTGKIKKEIRSLFVYGKYKKLVRNIPQSKWACPNCKGKGCVKCKGSGKLYPTSVQEIIEKPLLKATGAKKSAFHASGREDIDARCLDYRPFVIELIKPLKRKINLKEMEKKINESKKVKVKLLKLVDKSLVVKLKSEKSDKTYLAEVEFEKEIDEEKLKELKKLEGQAILQKTPLRVLHRRANKIRKRIVKKISWKVLGKKKCVFKIRAQAGLYIKELISGDEGRTKPNISELISNRPKKIKLDVIKIHRGGR